MNTPRPLLAVTLLVLPLAGCLENDEEIEVLADGSVEVTVRAHGDVRDLAEGFAVPLHGPWVPGGQDTPLWLEHVGATTGGAWAHDRVREVDWRSVTGREEEKVTLEASARFASVTDWPRFLSPKGEPYREAYAERSASLQVERRGRYTVYTFERIYHGRRREGFDLIHTLFERTSTWPEDLSERIDDKLKLTPDDFAFLARELREVFSEVYGNLADGALRPDDEGPLTPAIAAAVGRAARERIAALVSVERIERMLDRMRALEDSGKDGGEPLLELEQEARATLRAAIDEELAARALPDVTRYTALGRLEFGFTAADHTSDLGDEKHHVRLRMPGTIVSGNYDELSHGTARWDFEAEVLDQGDRVMRAVSIVE